MNSLFASEQINLGRQIEVDLARGFTAILLIVCHVGLYIGNSADVVLYTSADIIGSEFGAPVFMALMGISLVYSKHTSPIDLFMRGVKLFFAGYALSVMRSLLPLWLFGNIDEWTTVAAFFVVDIFQFAGLSLMLLSLFKKLRLNVVLILFISIFMVAIGQLFMSFSKPIVENETAAYFLNLFFPVTEWSCFPFLTWFFFPAFGLNLGAMLSHCTDKDKLYGIMLPVGFAAVLYVYYQFYMLYPDYTAYYYGNNFYYMGIKNVLLTACFVCFSLSFWHFAEKILPETAKRYFVFLSVNLTLYYVVSWVIISALIHVKALVQWNQGQLTVVLLIAVLIAVCAQVTAILKETAKMRG